ncbi:hypothetical protein [Streptomyces sp. NPDC004589]|uniref:hypothetical protein n=1 Tax=Streptomyces sp. NPDC004589 TaxID=3154553 RepID=UPI0033A8D559
MVAPAVMGTAARSLFEYGGGQAAAAIGEAAAAVMGTDGSPALAGDDGLGGLGEFTDAVHEFAGTAGCFGGLAQQGGAPGDVLAGKPAVVAYGLVPAGREAACPRVCGYAGALITLHCPS